MSGITRGYTGSPRSCSRTRPRTRARPRTGSGSRARCSIGKASRIGSCRPSPKAARSIACAMSIDDDGARVVDLHGRRRHVRRGRQGRARLAARRRGRDGHVAHRHRERSGQVVRARSRCGRARAQRRGRRRGRDGRLRRRAARDRARLETDPSRPVLRFVLDRPRRGEPRHAQPRSRSRAAAFPGSARSIATSSSTSARSCSGSPRATSSTSSSISTR